MAEFDPRVALKSLAIGIVAGLRCMMAPAIAIDDLARHQTQSPLLQFFTPFATKKGKNFSAVNSILEVLADKLPFIGARTQPGSVVVRCLCGAFAGSAIASSRKSSVAHGAAFGIAGALIGTFGGYHARKWLVEKTRLPDPVVALAEDGIAVALGRAATHG